MITVAMAVFIFVLASCGSSTAETTKPVPLANISIETNPNPAKTGAVELALNITDQNGSAISGAKVAVKATHPDMNGMSMSGLAIEQGGKYAIKTNFNMSGDWTITVYVRKEGLDIQQEIPLKVK